MRARATAVCVLALAILPMLAQADPSGFLWDNFDTNHTYWSTGGSVDVSGTIWDGVTNTAFTQYVRALNGELQIGRYPGATSVGNAPELFMNLSGDFDFWVKVPSFSGNQNYDVQGIMAYKDDTTLVRVDDAYSNGLNAYFQSYVAGVQTNLGSVSGTQTWLRLTRVGDLFTGYYSSTGATWTSLGSVTRTDLAGLTLKVGLFGQENNSLQNFVAYFDNFGSSTSSAPLPHPGVIPEPFSMAFMGMALAAVVASRVRKRSAEKRS